MGKYRGICKRVGIELFHEACEGDNRDCIVYIVMKVIYQKPNKMEMFDL